MSPSIPKRMVIALDVASMIAHGHLKPGDPIPTDGELAMEYRCSSSTVVQAVWWLKWEGLVQGRTTLGRFVTDGAPRICKEKGY